MSSLRFKPGGLDVWMEALNGGGIPSSPPTAAMGWRAYWSAMDATKLFADAGTTPVSANNDPVYQMNEILGVVASSALVQATEANRPLYKTGGAGGKSYLFFDGVGDTMANAITIDNYMAVGASTIIIALTVIVGYTNGGVVLRDASTWFDIKHNTGNVLNMRVWDTAYKTVAAAFTPGTPLVVTYKHDAGKIYSKVNDSAWSEGVTCGNRGGSTVLQLVGGGTGDVLVYGLALANVVVSDANITKVVNYFKGELGIS